MPVGNEITVEITGLRDLERALGSLPEKLAQKTLVSAAKKGIAPIQDAAETGAPYRTGKLERGIVIKSKIKGEGVAGATVVVTLGLKTGSRDPKSPSVFYGRFLETGTKFIKPQPFMKPAFNSWAVAAISLTAQEIKKGVEEAARSAR